MDCEIKPAGQAAGDDANELIPTAMCSAHRHWGSIAAPATRAGSAQPMTPGRVRAAGAEAAPPMTEMPVAAAGPACGRWRRRSGEVPTPGAGSPVRPTAAWRCRAPSAPGRRPLSSLQAVSCSTLCRKAARSCAIADSCCSSGAGALGAGDAAVSAASAQPLHLRQCCLRRGAATAAGLGCSTAISRPDGGWSPAATTNQAAGPCSRSSAWPRRRRTAKPRWPRPRCMPSPGSARDCARLACRARAGRSARSLLSRQGEAWRRATARSRAGRRRSLIPRWGDADPQPCARAWSELPRRRSNHSAPAPRHHHRGADRLALGSALNPLGDLYHRTATPLGCPTQAIAM